MPALERSAECAQFRISEHEGDCRQVAIRLLDKAQCHALAHRQQKLIECYVAFSQLSTEPMDGEPHLPGYGTNRRFALLALGLDDMREQTQCTVRVFAQACFAIHRHELVAYEHVNFGEGPRASLRHRQLEE